MLPGIPQQTHVDVPDHLDPVTGGIITGGLKLIGGLFGANSAAKTSIAVAKINRAAAKAAYRKAWRNSAPKVTRRRMENAGINPLLAWNSGGVGAASAPGPIWAEMQDNGAAIGSMIAGAFGGAADMFMQGQALELQRSELEMERQRLQDISARMTLTPKYAGIYGANNANFGPTGGDAGYPDSAGNSGSPWPQETDVRTPPARDQYNLYVDVYDSQTERWITIPNPDLMDTGPMEAAYSMAAIGSADVAQNAFKFGGTGAADQVVTPKERPYKSEQRNSYELMSQDERDAYREAHRSGFMMMSDPSNLYFYNQ